MDREDIATYLWNKSPSHLKDNQPKEEKDSYKLFEIWAGRGYELRETQKQIRLYRLPQTASPNALYLLAKERGIEKFDFETEEEFRQRVINALGWHRLKGTTKGIKTILAAYGFKDVKVDPALKYNPQDWAEFNVIIPDTLNEKEIKDVIKLVNLVKPSHEKISSLTDGRCKGLLISGLSVWDNALLDDIEGIEIEGVKVCFTEASDLSLKVPIPKTSQNTYSTYGNTAYYPFVNRLDFINWDNWIEKELNINSKTLKEINAKYKIKASNFNDISIYRDELSDEGVYYDEGIGFIGEAETIDSLFFDNSYFDSQIIQKLTLLTFQYKAEEIKPEKPEIKIKSISGAEISKEIDNRLNLSIETSGYTEAITETNSLKLKRNWKGRWIGKWTDNYQIEGKIEVR